MASLQLEIVTPSASVYSGSISEVVLPAWDGQMGVFPQHDALLALLRAGPCTISAADGVHKFVVGRGFADIGPTSVTLLTDSCEPIEGIDKAQAAADLKAGEKDLAEALVGTEAHNQAIIAIEIAKARLEA